MPNPFCRLKWAIRPREDSCDNRKRAVVVLLCIVDCRREEGTSMSMVAHNETTGRMSAKAVVILAVLVAVLFAALLVVPGKAFAADEVHLQDGQTYDLSQVQSATCVYVDTSGTFKLVGSSSKVLVDVQVPKGRSATIVLDGVTLTPGADAPGDSDDARSAIAVRDTDNGGGQVSLVSAAGTTSKIEGCKNKPAIQKLGTKAELVFKTEDPSNAGTIVARADSSAFRTCAIGAYGSYTEKVANTAGNIVFESGSVEAYGSLGDGTGSSGGAGIGANAGSFVDGVTFKGGSVTAVAGDGSAAGIGTSSADVANLGISGQTAPLAPCDARNISIEGGTVTAKHAGGSNGEGGAGIGGGYGCTADGISISGGMVYAEGSTGIGGGSNGDGLNISITGGKVEACGQFTGIGGGKSTGTVTENAGTWFGEATVDISGGVVNAYCSGSAAGVGIGGWKSCVAGSESLNGKGHVSISGGQVTAKGTGSLAGIGTGLCGSLDCVSISGGRVYAEGGVGDSASSAPGIGMAQDVQAPLSGIGRISISGGTVEAVAAGSASYSIGAHLSASASDGSTETPVYISGGNVKAPLGFNVAPKQSADGKKVLLCQVDTETYGHESDLSGRTVSELTVQDALNGKSESVLYGFNDMHPFKGAGSAATYYLWLPSCDERSIELCISPESSNMPHGDADFSGISDNSANMLVYPRVRVELVADPIKGEIGESGSVVFAQGFDSIDYKRAVCEGKKLVGYSLSKDGSDKVLDAQGRLIPNAIDSSGTPFADAAGRFVGSNSSRYEGLALYAQWEDTDGAVQFDPNKPSGVSAPVSGVSDNKNLDVGDQIQLEDEPSLAGYSFTGWNTKPDGSGELYGIGDYVSITEAGEVITLYAQWQRSDYVICFMPNGGQLESGEANYCQQAFFGVGTRLDTPEMRLQSHHRIGWNTDPDGTGEAYELGETVNDLAKTGGETVYLYAQWDADTYTVAYDGNGADGSMDPDTLECGIAHLLPNRGFSYQGHTFTGWNTASDGSGKSFTPEASYADLASVNGSVTLYAQWKEDTAPDPEPEPTPDPDPEPTPKPDPSPIPDSASDSEAPQPQGDTDTKQALADTGDSSMDAQAVLALAALAGALTIALLRRRMRLR